MMKKIIMGGLALMLGIVMLAISVWQVRAANEATDSAQMVGLMDQEVHYYLPYPGILPDHPLYWVKMLRDKVREMVTSSQSGKVDLWMSMADKRLGAAKALIEGNKVELGTQTAAKSTAYLRQAVSGLEQLKSEGTNVGERANNMERETLKHAQILDELSLVSMSEEVLMLHDRVLVVLERE